MKVKLMALVIMLSLVTSSMQIVGMTHVAAAKGEQQPPQEQEVIAPALKEKLASMSPTDNISVIVYLKGDPNLDEQIRAIWEGQPDDEMHTLYESLMQKYRNVYQELGPSAVEQLRKGDPATIDQYNELKQKYGLTEEFTKAAVQRLTELNDAKGEQVLSLHEQAYSEMLSQAKQRIEQLPDTEVTSSNFSLNNLGVETKVRNIEALAAIPDVIIISDNPSGVPAVSPQLGLALLSPADGSTSQSVKQVSFFWTPFKEATKYKFVLAKDTDMTQIIKEAQVPDINYEYDGSALDYDTIYFWRVMVLEPAPSDWSATFSFQTEALTSPPETPIQSSSWNFIITLVLTIAVAAIIGFTIWLIVARVHR